MSCFLKENNSSKNLFLSLYVFWRFVVFVLSNLVFFFGSAAAAGARRGPFLSVLFFLQPANPRSHAHFRNNMSFWCISSPGTYLERCAVKFRSIFQPELLILKTKTFPLCKNNENLEFRSQCKVLCFGI